MTSKKGKKMLSTADFTTEELEWATQVVEILDKVMAEQSPTIKFEHLALWWTLAAAAEA